LKSIAFPAVGTGIAGFPMRECAEIMLEETVKHLRGSTTLERVDFVLYDQPALRVFEEVFAKMQAEATGADAGGRA
jgi:O-acetyl-ADP-ribose deacetylase (regulator of RNase III)